MIKPEDLRIGNYMKTDTGEIGKVSSIGYSNDGMPHIKMIPIKDDWKVNGFELSRPAGIELDHSWLLRLGFEPEKDFPNVYRLKKELKFSIYKKENGFTLLCSDIRVAFTSIHHLQNAYFGHTGQQLEILEIN